jgi:hypothetical protein
VIAPESKHVPGDIAFLNSDPDRKVTVMVRRFLADPVWREWSDRSMGERLGVSHTTIKKYRVLLSVHGAQIEKPAEPKAISPPTPRVLQKPAAVASGEDFKPFKRGFGAVEYGPVAMRSNSGLAAASLRDLGDAVAYCRREIKVSASSENER